MGIFVQYDGSTPEGLSFQGCYLKLSSFVSDTSNMNNIVLVGRFTAYLTREAALSGKAAVRSVTFPLQVTLNTTATELQHYSFGMVEFLYEKYMAELLKQGFQVEQVLEENQTAPPVPVPAYEEPAPTETTE